MTDSDKKMRLPVKGEGNVKDIICSNDEMHSAALSFAEVRSLWITGNIVSAIENFRERGAVADVRKLYAAYLWLKNEIINLGPEYTQQMNLFNTVFLSMIEERGEVDSDIYISVLRDSSEYHFFNSLVGKSPVAETEKISPESPAGDELSSGNEEVEKSITLHDILYSPGKKPADCSMEIWKDLIRKHFEPIDDEELFINESRKVIKRLKAVKEKELFHLEMAAVFAIEWLSSRRSLSLDSKDYAEKLMELMAGSGALWRKLHEEYIIIIKKPSSEKRASR